MGCKTQEPIQEVKIEKVVVDGRQHGYVIPENYKLVKAEDRLEKPFDHDNTRVEFLLLPEFAAYVREFKKENTRIIPMHSKDFVCFIDYHKADEPKFVEDHKAVFSLRKDPDFVKWEELNDKWQTQKQFADFMADYAPEFQDTDQAFILNLAKKIKVADNESMDSEYAGGTLNFMFNKTVKATFDGGEPPEKFAIGLPVYHGFAKFALPLRIFWKKEEGEVKLKFVFIRLHLVRDVAFKDAAEDVATATETTVYGYKAKEAE